MENNEYIIFNVVWDGFVGVLEIGGRKPFFSSELHSTAFLLR